MIYSIIEALPSAFLLWLGLFLLHKAKLSANKTSGIKHLQIGGLYWAVLSVSYIVAGPPSDMSSRSMAIGFVGWISIFLLFISLVTWFNGRRKQKN